MPAVPVARGACAQGAVGTRGQLLVPLRDRARASQRLPEEATRAEAGEGRLPAPRGTRPSEHRRFPPRCSCVPGLSCGRQRMKQLCRCRRKICLPSSSQISEPGDNDAAQALTLRTWQDLSQVSSPPTIAASMVSIGAQRCPLSCYLNNNNDKKPLIQGMWLTKRTGAAPALRSAQTRRLLGPQHHRGSSLLQSPASLLA